MREVLSLERDKHLFIVNDFPPIIGGQSAYLYYLCRALPPGNIVVLAPQCGDTAAFDRAQRFPIVRKSYLFHIPVLEKVAKIILPFFWIQGLVRREGIVVLHCAHVLSTGFIGLAMKKLRGIDYVIYTHSADILEYANNFFLRPWLKRILAGACYVVTNSRFTQSKLEELGVESSRILRSAPRIDSAEFALLPETTAVVERYGLKGKRIILSLNRLVERKGNDVVIMAWPQILKRFPDAVYVIFGRGPWGSKLHKLVEDMKLAGSVVFVDAGEEEKKALLAACEVFVMVSREIKGKGDAEGFGVVYLEAGACGKPVVAGDSGGVRDAVQDNVNGFLVDPENPGAVADAISKLLSDHGLAQLLGSQGRARVLAEFDYRSGVTELDPIFRGEGRG